MARQLESYSAAISFSELCSLLGAIADKARPVEDAGRERRLNDDPVARSGSYIHARDMRDTKKQKIVNADVEIRNHGGDFVCPVSSCAPFVETQASNRIDA